MYRIIFLGLSDNIFYGPLVWVGSDNNNNKTRHSDDYIDLSVEKASVSFLFQTETVTLIFDLKLQLSSVYLQACLISMGSRCRKYI